MKVEYLVLIDSAEHYCQSIRSLNNLIQSYDQININNTELDFNGFTFNYHVAFDNIEGGTQRYFHITLGLNNKSDEEKFRELLKLFRTILTKISGRPPEILWDEMASKLCEKAYPKLHNTENLLRKLITKFMLLNIGIAWTKEVIPSEVEESIKTKKSDRSANYLHDLDFIQLSNLLFKEYSTGDIRKITEKISKSTTAADLDILQLKELVPTSNWQRYFAPIIECDSGYLKKRWDRLYELRCKVAHNRYITIDELDEINKLTDEVNEKFNKAIGVLAQVKMSDIQKEEVAGNVAAVSNDLYADFLDKWEILLSSLKELCEVSPSTRKEAEKIDRHDWEKLTAFAIKEKYMNEDSRNVILDLSQFRNAIVRNPDIPFTNETVLSRISTIEYLIEELWEAEEGIRIGWSRMLEAM